jgi:hypothetical protein
VRCARFSAVCGDCRFTDARIEGVENSKTRTNGQALRRYHEACVQELAPDVASVGVKERT